MDGEPVVATSLKTYVADPNKRVLGRADGSGYSVLYYFQRDAKEINYSAFVTGDITTCNLKD
jgi:hypothetical protein